MTEKTYKLINAIAAFFGIAACVSLIYILYYFAELDAESRLIVHNILLTFSIISMLVFLAFFIWVSKTNKGKIYEKMYNDHHQAKIDNQLIDEIKGTQYYDTIPEYTGKSYFVPCGLFLKKVSRIAFFILIGITIILILYLIIEDNNLSDVIPVILMILIIPMGSFLSYLFSLRRKVFINEDGVQLISKSNGKCTNLFFSWENIKVIGISVSPTGKRISNGYLYFTTREIEQDRCIPEYFEKPYVIMLKYRPEAIHCLLQYWDKEVRNLEAMKSWKRYLYRIK